MDVVALLRNQVHFVIGWVVPYVFKGCSFFEIAWKWKHCNALNNYSYNYNWESHSDTALHNRRFECPRNILLLYEGLSKIFWIDVKILKITIDCHHPWSSTLPHVDIGPNVSSILVMLPGSPFLSECQALLTIWPGSSQSYQTSVLLVSFLETWRIHSVPNHGSTVGGGWQLFNVLPETAGRGQKCETGHCHSEATRSVLAKVQGDIFACFHAVAAKVTVEPRIHSLAFWYKFFVLPQLLYKWRHHSRIFWIPPHVCLVLQKNNENGLIQGVTLDHFCYYKILSMGSLAAVWCLELCIHKLSEHSCQVQCCTAILLHLFHHCYHREGKKV
jgi:hypothetical protein